MSDNPTPLANNIRFLRRKAGLSQEELAQQLGINRSNIAAYESKNVEPRLRIILEIARYFDISIKSLIENNLHFDSTYSAFILNRNNRIESEQVLQTYDIKRILSFIEHSKKIRKVLEGFKAFYSFRKEHLKQIPPDRSRLIYDIENFIQLTEHLLSYNEKVVHTISKNASIPS